MSAEIRRCESILKFLGRGITPAPLTAGDLSFSTAAKRKIKVNADPRFSIGDLTISPKPPTGDLYVGPKSTNKPTKSRSQKPTEDVELREQMIELLMDPDVREQIIREEIAAEWRQKAEERRKAQQNR